jgi:hypothetical protein
VSKRLAALLSALLLAALVGGAWALRVAMTHGLPIWDATNPVGTMKSDPALLYWFTERIAEAGGTIPADFAQCKSVQWPDVVDARVEFPQLQPWLAAATWRAFGGATPLHEWCVLLFSLLAATTLASTFGLARELTGSRALAFAAAAIAFVLPANWRTATHVLLGEDVAIPALACHLWLLARAARLRSPVSFLLAGAPLAVAMAAWHATGFFVAIEAGALFAWYLRSGKNALATPRAWLVLLPFAVACLFEPMLRGKLALLSLPMVLAFALLALAAIERRRKLTAAARCGAAAGLVALLLGVGVVAGRIAGGGLGDYSHVFRLIAAKLLHCGVRPADPAALPFEVRILWQGPFETTSPAELWSYLSLPLLGGVAAIALAWRAWRRRGAEARAGARADNGTTETELPPWWPPLAPFLLAALLAAWLITRTLVLPGLLLPIASLLVVQRVAKGRLAVGAMAALLFVVPGLAFPGFVEKATTKNLWHGRDHAAEIRAAVAAVAKLVPEGEAIASDEINSTALLAHARRPILVQPKYEWTAARARLEEYRMVATRGTPRELADWMRSRKCRWLLLDWYTLWGTRYQAGLPDSATGMDTDTALALAYQKLPLPGFRELWRSGGKRDGMRLYVLE